MYLYCDKKRFGLRTGEKDKLFGSGDESNPDWPVDRRTYPFGLASESHAHRGHVLFNAKDSCILWIGKCTGGPRVVVDLGLETAMKSGVLLVVVRGSSCQHVY